MIGTPGRVVAAVVTGSFVLVGGAGGAAGSSAAVKGTAGATCHGGSVGFAFSLASTARGSVNPVVAARDFVRTGGAGPEGRFGSSSSRWRIGPATSFDVGGVAVSDGAVFLDTVKLANGRWAVDSGGRCS